MEAGGEGNCVEIASGKYKKVRTICEKLRREIDQSGEIISESINSAKHDIRRVLGNNVNGIPRNDDGNFTAFGNGKFGNDNTSAGFESDIGRNKRNEEVKFSLKDNVEETDKLIAVHNLTAEKLSRSLDLGGLPMPSITIAKAKQGNNEFEEK